MNNWAQGLRDGTAGTDRCIYNETGRSQVQNTGQRSQVIVLPIMKQPKPLANANFKLTLGLNTLSRLKVSISQGFGLFSIGKTMTCDLCFVPANRKML